MEINTDLHYGIYSGIKQGKSLAMYVRVQQYPTKVVRLRQLIQTGDRDRSPGRMMALGNAYIEDSNRRILS